jgi:hypothetical protein
MPRDFDVPGGMAFTFGQLPDGRWMPALAAKEQHLRTVQRGRRAGQQTRARVGQVATSGQGEVQFWLVPRVQPSHDPDALPDQADLTERANTRAAKALSQELRRLGAEDTP